MQESSRNICDYGLPEHVTNVSPHWPRACHQTVVKETVTHHVWGRGARTSGRLSHGPCDLGRSVCTRHVLHFPRHARPAGVRLSELAIALVCVLCSSLEDVEFAAAHSQPESHHRLHGHEAAREGQRELYQGAVRS